jgi:hypothetical protein
MLLKLFTPFAYSSMTKRERWIINAFSVSVLLLIWQLWPGYLIPRPMGTLSALGRLYDRGLVVEMFVSIKVIVVAGLLSYYIGKWLGYLYLLPFFRAFILFFATLRNTSMTVIVAALIMLRFEGYMLKLVTMTFVITVYYVASLVQEFRRINQADIDHAITTRLNPWQGWWRKVVRERRDVVFFTFIPNLAMGWAMLSFVEGLARQEGGLGDLTLQVDKVSNYEGLAAIGLVSLLLGLAMWMGLWAWGQHHYRFTTSEAITT